LQRQPRDQDQSKLSSFGIPTSEIELELQSPVNNIQPCRECGWCMANVERVVEKFERQNRCVSTIRIIGNAEWTDYPISPIAFVELQPSLRKRKSLQATIARDLVINITQAIPIFLRAIRAC